MLLVGEEGGWGVEEEGREKGRESETNKTHVVWTRFFSFLSRVSSGHQPTHPFHLGYDRSSTRRRWDGHRAEEDRGGGGTQGGRPEGRVVQEGECEFLGSRLMSRPLVFVFPFSSLLFFFSSLLKTSSSLPPIRHLFSAPNPNGTSTPTSLSPSATSSTPAPSSTETTTTSGSSGSWRGSWIVGIRLDGILRCVFRLRFPVFGGRASLGGEKTRRVES